MRCPGVPLAAGCHGGGGVLPVPPPRPCTPAFWQRFGDCVAFLRRVRGGQEAARLRGRAPAPLCPALTGVPARSPRHQMLRLRVAAPSR